MIPEPLRHVPQVMALDRPRCQRLSQGTSNRSWRVTSEAGDWVVRINAPNAALDRAFECAVLKAVAVADLGPTVVACEPAAGYLVTGFLPGPAWTAAAFDDPAAVAALARSLRELHALREPQAEPADWRGELGRKAARGDLADSEALKRGLAALFDDIDQTGFDQGPLALCHHDLHCGNIVGTGPVRFVDFEYARWTHPAMDIAWLIQYHDLLPEQIDLLLSAYYGRSGPDVAGFIALAVRISQYQELLWLAERHAGGGLTPAASSRLRALRLVLT